MEEGESSVAQDSKGGEVERDTGRKLLSGIEAAVGVEHELITIESGGHGFDGQWWQPEVEDAQGAGNRLS
ncbi:MAG: hypothetical protein QGH25_19025 [Candidatus Latescibacteria bacterium]|jgi:hypothetical protein|nr:hypothetical protein [Candidatus Latescibacterota bacterium]